MERFRVLTAGLVRTLRCSEQEKQQDSARKYLARNWVSYWGNRNITMLWGVGIWHLAAGAIDMDQLLIKWSLFTELTTSAPRRP
jgi:hypothetical protein